MRVLSVVAVVVLSVAMAVANPGSTKARDANTRGMKLYGAKDYRHAADEFRAAIALDSDYVLARYNLASMAALVGDKATVLVQLRWLHDSRDPEAAKALAHARTDPDLKSVIDDPDVAALIKIDPNATCMRTCDELEAKCTKKCDDRGCFKLCAQGPPSDCRAGCGLGMTGEATMRMRAWLDGPLLGRDNDMANMRTASISRHDVLDTDTYDAFIKNQFGFTCTVTWGGDGSPAKLSSCKASDPVQWQASPAELPVRCAIDKTAKHERCTAGFHLLGGGMDQPGEIVLQRTLK